MVLATPTLVGTKLAAKDAIALPLNQQGFQFLR